MLYDFFTLVRYEEARKQSKWSGDTLDVKVEKARRQIKGNKKEK